MELNPKQFATESGAVAYVGLTARVGGLHAAKPETYDPHGGWAKAHCGTAVSVDHRGDTPIPIEYTTDVSCKKCKTAMRKRGLKDEEY